MNENASKQPLEILENLGKPLGILKAKPKKTWKTIGIQRKPQKTFAKITVSPCFKQKWRLKDPSIHQKVSLGGSSVEALELVVFLDDYFLMCLWCFMNVWFFVFFDTCFVDFTGHLPRGFSHVCNWSSLNNCVDEYKSMEINGPPSLPIKTLWSARALPVEMRLATLIMLDLPKKQTNMNKSTQTKTTIERINTNINQQKKQSNKKLVGNQQSTKTPKTSNSHISRKNMFKNITMPCASCQCLWPRGTARWDLVLLQIQLSQL